MHDMEKYVGFKKAHIPTFYYFCTKFHQATHV